MATIPNVPNMRNYGTNTAASPVRLPDRPAAAAAVTCVDHGADCRPVLEQSLQRPAGEPRRLQVMVRHLYVCRETGTRRCS